MDFVAINGYWFLFSLTGVVVLYLLFEILRHNAALKKIPIRIHVNGTRGKSSVARLIASGLRGGKIKTCAKTTGTMARFIFPDGSEEPVYRYARTNIIEQVGVIRRSAKRGAQALVIECMALQPLLQSLCELRLVRSTHGVLCNAREDHLDVMGPLESDVALALAGTMTVKGHFFTPEKKHLGIFKMAARDRETQLHSVSDEAIAAISDEDMAGFSYGEHKENVALALAVCQFLKVSREDALKGMWSANPDPGAMTKTMFCVQGKQFCFVNVFAANDPLSTGQIWASLREEFADYETKTLLMNCRVDRKDRSRQIAEAALTWPEPDCHMAIGTGIDVYCQILNGKQTTQVIEAEGWDCEAIINTLAAQSNQSKHLIVGVGNIKGIGFQLVDYVYQLRENK
jgi:poly-gamma-glutamate synthase PgsB/CapB